MRIARSTGISVWFRSLTFASEARILSFKLAWTWVNSLVSDLLAVAIGICEDIQSAYSQRVVFDRDVENLTRYCQSRGLGFFTFDLPNLDSILLNGLETGRLLPEGPLSRVVSSKTNVPRFFSGLWLRVFDNSGCLKQDADVDAIRFLRQVATFAKRISVDCTPSRISSVVEEYHDIDEALRPPTLSWSADDLDAPGIGGYLSLADYPPSLPLFPNGKRECGDLLRRCQRVADIIIGQFSFYEPSLYSEEQFDRTGKSGFRHGPGAVSDRKGTVNKYNFPRWSDKLERWFPYSLCGRTAGAEGDHPSNHEMPSRLIAVPKTAKGPRLIASEPTEHQWCQQLTRHFMVEELRRIFGSSFICFSRQELSQDLVLRASKDARLATVDLSSASDRLSCWVVERVFRKGPSILHALHASRTRYIREDILAAPSFLKMKKFASQGTAVTFPVQSLVFLCLALGVSIDKPSYRIEMSDIWKMRHQVRVFGDDIIIPTHAYDSLVQVMDSLELKVNDSKSFYRGRFRESCGLDAFGGINITPVKITHINATTPAGRASLIDTSNNFFRSGYWRTAEILESKLPGWIRKNLPVVGLDCGVLGLTSFCGSDVSHLKYRWNTKLQRDEVRCFAITSKAHKQPIGEWHALLQWFTEDPPEDLNWTNGVAGRPKVSNHLRWETTDLF